jgi:hypothetical protein
MFVINNIIVNRINVKNYLLFESSVMIIAFFEDDILYVWSLTSLNYRNIGFADASPKISAPYAQNGFIIVL